MQALIDFCDPHGQQPALRCAFDAPQRTLVANTLDQVIPLLNEVEKLSQQGLWCVGYLRYESAPAFDAALQVHTPDGPLAWFGVYTQAHDWPASTPIAEKDQTQVLWHSQIARGEFDANMKRIHQSIAAGEFYQLNYTAQWLGNFSGHPHMLFERLRRAQPHGYSGFIAAGDEYILSVSPELFFDWHNGHLLTRPMKGTAPRGNTPTEDEANTLALKHSAKERAENVMIVDLLRNDVSRIAQAHSVNVPRLFDVQTLPTVLQMTSDVVARTREGTTLSEVFGALFPCGSVTGAPKVQAMQTIKSLEPAPRGVYCGAIGIVRPGGHATFNVAIRTVTLRGNQANCGIGSGITCEATADAEWQEWQTKRGFLTRASQTFNLLETMRVDHGQFHLLDLHLARLKRAAHHFGYPFDEPAIRQALKRLQDTTANKPNLIDDPAKLWRVRLQLDEQGHVHTEAFKQNSTPAFVNIALAATYFEANQSEFTRFKTTQRAHYEAAAPSDPRVFDTLLYNVQGELTEFTRGNVAVLLNGQWLTPPLRCGLLDGVGRAQYLAESKLREGVVTLDDLPQAQDIAFINSLRGWVQARFADSPT
ncbi:MAG: aminodeoxychorismate synthase component I [Rhodoferax sp.]|nr:aminodeoxychorismate synthase component I [Rhodoferax sp.]